MVSSDHSTPPSAADDASDSGPPTDGDGSGSGPSVRRRAVLAGAASLVGSGCIQRSRALVGRDSPEQLSLSIKTVPADADTRATTVARTLADRLTTVGVDAQVVLASREELYRDVLLNQKFDLYVARFPHAHDPDFLRPLLHSRFNGEPGWGNPFGYASLELDELLDAQRGQSGTARQRTLREIERVVVRDQPFSVLAFPEEIRTAHTDRVTGWASDGASTSLHYLEAGRPQTSRTNAELDAVTGRPAGDRSEESRLRVTLGDSRPTENLNPLAVEYRTGTAVTGLIYDSLGRWIDGSVGPWLASDWEWGGGADGDGLTAVVTLREDLTWHDGEPLTAADVAFTYRFLADTSLGALENAVPAPNYRREASLVESVSVRGDDRVELEFGPTSRRVAAAAFAAPILPELEWADRNEPASIAGLAAADSITEALVWDNPTPVGSGPLRFDRSKEKESLVLTRFDDHFLARESIEGPPARYAGGFAFDALEFSVVPSGAAAVELVAGGSADATASPVPPETVPDIGGAPDLALRVTHPNAFYHVGFNVREAPNSNTRFRRAVAALLDRESLVEEFFGGFAEPAVSPLGRDGPLSPDLGGGASDIVVPFAGENGHLDVDKARENFREAGYRYSSDGRLLTR
ncbi:ABC transporter substrate-binding protein (plasmid) [Halorarum halophilum]|uniref:ABC transporter substrate-binding protein n=1 Tax=Halorarum halophilum TaxID=2743090 RepID=A0A7D5KAA9_9EURY|nr:ABC transporter substrate-binding protein [Halobaculum halophilum]QLG29719.1 ABC transporter substrate-binding protein [Halobaculum halophilum]